MLQQSEVLSLMAAQLSIDAFGPKTDYPYLFFSLSCDDKDLADWLIELPCPVIGLRKMGETCLELESACDVLVDTADEAQLMITQIQKTPLAALVLVQQLRLSENLSLSQALTAESLAYASVQKGPEFSAWLQTYTAHKTKTMAEPLLVSTSSAGKLDLVFNDPENHNAINAAMRDALCEAFELARLDPDITEVHLSAQGRSFSIGGDINEFGQISDPATAHWIRSIRLPARHLSKLKKPLSVCVEGAAIGAGVEISAFAQHVSASSKAWFQLPELKYGLIPGAGGTVSLVRRIGRHKTAYMALSMKKIKAGQAYDWGLVDALLE